MKRTALEGISRLLIVFTCAVVLSAVPHRATATDTYSYTTLSDPSAAPEFGSGGDGISNNGLVVGDYGYYSPGGAVQDGGFIYSGGTYSNFVYPYPETGGDGDAGTIPGGINDSGQVAGYAQWQDNAGINRQSGFIYQAGSFTDLNEPGYPYNYLEAINDSGQIVGTACVDDETGPCHGFMWSGGTFTDLSDPSGSDTIPVSINNLGQILGQYDDAGGHLQTFIYQNGTYTTITALAVSCYPEAINDLGQILADCGSASSIYQNGVLAPLSLQSNVGVSSINNSGVLVGNSGETLGVIATPLNPQSAKDDGNPCDQPGNCGAGEPISIASGNVFYQTTDYQTSGQNKLSFTRYYNSRAVPTFALTLGMNWRSTYDRYIRILSSTSIMVERADGQQLTFTLSGSNWTTDSDVDLHLTNSGTTWTLTDSTDTVETYTTVTGGFEALLNAIAARDGYTQTLHYNASNQLTSVSDSYSRSLGFTYSGGLIQTVTTPDSLVLTYGYTVVSQGTQLTSTSFNTSPATNVAYHYGESGAPFSALTSIIDEDSQTYATWTYDAFSRGLTSQLGVGANLITMTYNADGTTTVKNALGVKDTYTFTTLQGVPKITQISRAALYPVAAATRTIGYDGNGYVNSSTDWNGNQTTYVNDARGQPTTINEAVGSPVARTTTITYDTTTPNTTYPYHLPTQSVTTGLTTNFNYDASGDLLTKVLTDTTTQTVPYSTNGQTRTWTYTWLNHLLHSVQTPRTDVTNKTTFSYDTSGALVQISNALAQKTKITSHTGGGLPLTVVDPDNVTTLLTYDPRNYLLTSTLVATGGNLITAYGYDAAENLTSVTLPDGSELVNGYDTAHRLDSITDLFSNQIQYTLDALGDRTLIDTLNPSSTLERQHSGMFDGLGRTTQDIGGMGQTTKFTYDPNSNALTITDPLTHRTVQTFDALNRLSTVTDPSPGGTTTTTYDAHDRPLTVQSPINAVTSYVYDGFGDTIQQASPDSGTTVYHYDADSDLTQKVDATSATTNNTYDALDRVLTTTYPSDTSENVSYTYDQTTGHGYGIGRLTSLTDAAGTIARVINQRGDISGETRVIGGHSLPTAYTYDAANRVATITYPSGTVVTYVRDTMGRVTSVTSKAPGAGSAVNVATGVGYEPFGPLTGMTFGNAVVDARTYDLDYRLGTLTDTGTAALQNLTYGYDAANNVKTITDGITSGNSQTLGYDNLNRLNSAVGNYGSLGYSYDKAGNRLFETVAPTTTYTYTPNTNLLATVKTGGVTQTIGTTAAGNITSVSPATPTGITALLYNQANRLATANAGTTQVAAYTYDAFGQRLQKVTTATTLLQYDQNGHLLEELNGSGAAQADYLYLGDMPLATLTPSTGALYFLHNESLGTPQLATSSTQATAWQTTYQPFGTTGTITGALTQNIRLPGQYADAETGFSQNGARDYAPTLGRYLETDPIGLAGGYNTFGYVKQNPGKYTDRSGTVAGVDDVVGAVALCIADPACALAVAAGLKKLGDMISHHADIPAPIPTITMGPLCPPNFNNDTADNNAGNAAADAAIGSAAAAGDDASAVADSPNNDVQQSSTDAGTGTTITPDDLEGKTPEEIDDMMQGKGWPGEPTSGPGGTRYPNPDVPGEQVRVMPGNPADPNPVKQGPYGRISSGGQVTPPIPLFGNPTLSR